MPRLRRVGSGAEPKSSHQRLVGVPGFGEHGPQPSHFVRRTGFRTSSAMFESLHHRRATLVIWFLHNETSPAFCACRPALGAAPRRKMDPRRHPLRRERRPTRALPRRQPGRLGQVRHGQGKGRERLQPGADLSCRRNGSAAYARRRLPQRPALLARRQTHRLPEHAQTGGRPACPGRPRFRTTRPASLDARPARRRVLGGHTLRKGRPRGGMDR